MDAARQARAHASDQVAALIGVTPAAVDPGQPVRLALDKADTRSPRLPQLPSCRSGASAGRAAPSPVVARRSPRRRCDAGAGAVAGRPGAAAAARRPSRRSPQRRSPRPRRCSLRSMPHSCSAGRQAAPRKSRVASAAVAVRRGNSPAVVQLGAYGSPERVLAAWNGAARKYGALKAYLPMSARFASPKGTFYRLSVRGFASDREARLRCASRCAARAAAASSATSPATRRSNRVALGGAADHQLEAGHPHGHAHFDLKRDQRAFGIVGDARRRSRRRGSSGPGCMTTAPGCGASPAARAVRP